MKKKEMEKKKKKDRLAIMVSETGLPGIAHTAGSDRRFSIYYTGCPVSD